MWRTSFENEISKIGYAIAWIVNQLLCYSSTDGADSSFRICDFQYPVLRASCQHHIVVFPYRRI